MISQSVGSICLFCSINLDDEFSGHACNPPDTPQISLCFCFLVEEFTMLVAFSFSYCLWRQFLKEKRRGLRPVSREREIVGLHQKCSQLSQAKGELKANKNCLRPKQNGYDFGRGVNIIGAITYTPLEQLDQSSFGPNPMSQAARARAQILVSHSVYRITKLHATQGIFTLDGCCSLEKRIFCMFRQLLSLFIPFNLTYLFFLAKTPKY